MKTALNEAIGTRSLCAWLVGPGTTWVQTREPHYARKLSQRADARLIAHGVAGGYLRIYSFSHGLAWARRLISRYTRNETATGTSINQLPCLNEPSQNAGSMAGGMEPTDRAKPTKVGIKSPGSNASVSDAAGR